MVKRKQIASFYVLPLTDIQRGHRMKAGYLPVKEKNEYVRIQSLTNGNMIYIHYFALLDLYDGWIFLSLKKRNR